MGVEELTELQSDCYYVEYDKYGRIYKQYIPGSGYTISLYDAKGRLAFSQNTLQREKNKWSFTKYDAFDRPVISGICSGTETEFRQTLANQKFQNEKRGTDIHGYTNRVCPTYITSEDCLEITYYDDYSWPGQEMVAWSAADALDEGYSDRVIGQITGTKTRVLGDTVAQWLVKANYYDSRYLLLQMVSQLYPSGIEITSNKHSFGGGVLTAKVKQIVENQVTEYLKYFDYDKEGRLIKIRQKISGDTLNEEVVLVKNTYDELGRLISYSLHNEKETIHYDYHIAGMLSSVSSPRFSYRLKYENAEIIDAARLLRFHFLFEIRSLLGEDIPHRKYRRFIYLICVCLIGHHSEKSCEPNQKCIVKKASYTCPVLKYSSAACDIKNASFQLFDDFYNVVPTYNRHAFRRLVA